MKKVLKFGVSRALMVMPMSVALSGCFIGGDSPPPRAGSGYTINPGPPDMDLCPDAVECGRELDGCPCYDVPINPGPPDMCPDEDVPCGEEAPGCGCYTLNPGPFCDDPEAICGTEEPGCPCVPAEPDMSDMSDLAEMGEDMGADAGGEDMDEMDGGAGDM